jgi:hypothetical protein
MAHLINKMAFVGETPWHGLGANLTPDASFDVWAKEAGLDFAVKRSPVKFETEDGIRDHGNRDVLFRDDNKIALGIVSPNYKIVQPEDVMAFFKSIADIGHFQMETAGSLMQRSPSLQPSAWCATIPSPLRMLSAKKTVVARFVCRTMPCGMVRRRGSIWAW